MKHIIRTIAMVLVISMLSVAAFAAADNGFTPSVEQKGAPTVVPKTEEVDGKPSIVIKDENGEIMEADDPDVLKVTPMADAEEQAPEVKEKMEKAFTDIAEAESLAEVAPELPDVLKKLDVKTPVEDLVVRDLIHLDVSEKLKESLKTSGNSLEISFEMQIEEGQQLIVMVMGDDGEWVIISGDDVVVNDDGTVSVKFSTVGVVAFVVA